MRHIGKTFRLLYPSLKKSRCARIVKVIDKVHLEFILCEVERHPTLTTCLVLLKSNRDTSTADTPRRYVSGLDLFSTGAEPFRLPDKMVRPSMKATSAADRRRPTAGLSHLLPLAGGDATPQDATVAPADVVLDRTRQLNEEYGLDDEDEAESRDYAGHARFGMDRDDADGQDWEGDPEEEEEAEQEEEEEAAEDYDSPLATPRSKRGLVGSSTPKSSTAGSPSNRSGAGTPRSRTGKGTPTTRTPRQRKPPAWMIDPSLPGFVRPTAADAYFLAAARPKRKRVEEADEEDEEEAEGDSAMLGTPHRSKMANRGAVVRGAEQVMSVEDRRRTLRDHHRAQYEQWRSLLLSSQNNLIFFGHGSKREMLEEFMTTTLQPEGHCISINGLFPGLKIRDVLLEIAIAFPEVDQCPVPDGLLRGIDKLAHKIYAYFLPSSTLPATSPQFATSSKPLFLLLHNIDGPGMRNERSLEILSLLASSPRIYVVTSFDHVHTPILFSTTLNNTPKHHYSKGGWTGSPPASRGFNWAWIQASTYAPYTVESEYVRQSAAYSGKALAGDDDVGVRDGAASDVTEEGALRILASVPPMAKRLFKLLATKQLAALPSDAQSSRSIPGANAATAPTFAIDSDILQALAKDKFIAREEERYNTQLTEYKDHGVIIEHTLDAENRSGRWLWIPFGKESLSRILQTMKDVEA
jgi:origin recognition complex subunit 2